MNAAGSFLFEAPFIHEERVYSKPHSRSVESWYGEDGSPASLPAMGTTQRPARLMKVENSPQSCTLYVDIRLGELGHPSPEAPAQPMTSIFFPVGYRVQQSVDLVVYLHGFKQDAHRAWSIDRYWHDLPRRAFREKLNESQKNAVLVAPTLGTHSNAGWLIRPGGFDRYMDLVMQTLNEYGPYEGLHPTVGNIILACHSGGGVPMRLVAGGGLPMRQAGWTGQRYAPLIRECWGFDCTYSHKSHIDSTEWGRWAGNRPDTHLYIHYIRHSGTAPEAEALQKQGRSNVTAIPSSTPVHDLVPITYWVPRLQQASFLNDK